MGLGRDLEMSWGHLGAILSSLGPSWAALGPPWALLAALMGPLGAVLGPLEAILRPPWMSYDANRGKLKNATPPTRNAHFGDQDVAKLGPS